MHTTREYNGDTKQALRDARQFLGPKRYNILAKAVITKEVTEEGFVFLCAFAGVQGFPVRCLWEHFNSGLGTFVVTP